MVVQWLSAPKAGSPGSIPGQGTRFHILQLRVHMLQLNTSAAKKNAPPPQSTNFFFFKHTLSNSLEIERASKLGSMGP